MSTPTTRVRILTDSTVLKWPIQLTSKIIIWFIVPSIKISKQVIQVKKIRFIFKPFGYSFKPPSPMLAEFNDPLGPPQKFWWIGPSWKQVSDDCWRSIGTVELLPVMMWLRPASSVTRFGEISQFGDILKVLGDYLKAYLVLGKNLNLLGSTFYAIGQVFIVANGLILMNYLAIWSHCRPDKCRSSQTHVAIPQQLLLFPYN